MTTLLMITGVILIGVGFGLMDPNRSNTKNSWKSKTKRTSTTNNDPFFGTPLEKF